LKKKLKKRKKEKKKMTKNFSCQKKQERSLALRGGENLGWEKEKKILQKYVQEVKKIKTNRYFSF